MISAPTTSFVCSPTSATFLARKLFLMPLTLLLPFRNGELDPEVE